MKAFLDTNVVVYAFTQDPRSEAAEALLAKGCDVSVQVLNEFTNVARRKLGWQWDEIDAALTALRALARAIHPVDLDTHIEALALAQRHGFAFYDALIVASALRTRCDVLYSEDLQHGMTVEKKLRIENPFRR
ncbi:PIN domain-containing protein [Novosphingobium sp. JCM 18896]|uniref:PIN domain-containing protein n=1 Tax=Novosphingobium sp. JCM 18896 TaxID=2989731 RepID=UPI002222870F|nr:PIN domain-containing protein [Novosphingobium sp. JCM 18896]MCW1427578.1 PIN domain-containing protein [Novosphingobium sp. JCM 18896]